MSDESSVERRDALRILGFGAVGAIAAATPLPVTAQPVARFAIDRTTLFDKRLLSAKLSDPRAVEALHLQNRLPVSTPITKMLTPEAARTLTPGARTLTKEDLLTMQAGKIPDRATNLTVRDIASIQGAFGRTGGLGPVAGDISCCCCTPCCCAAAVESDFALAA